MYRVRTAITGGPGGAELNTMFFNSALTFTAQQAADAVRQFWQACRPVVSSLYTFQVEPQVTEVADFTGHPIGVHSVTTTQVVGAATGDTLPPANQGLVHLLTGVYYNGRALQGKIYVPGAMEANNTAGAPDPTYLTTVGNAAAAMVADVNSEPFVFSRKNLNANGVTGTTVWSKWAVLRSRRD